MFSLANASVSSQPFSKTFADSQFYMPAQVFDTETVVEVTHKITAALEASEVFNSYLWGVRKPNFHGAGRQSVDGR